MCNKLIVLCLALVVVGLSVPASAAYIGFDADGNPNGCANPLKVDLTYLLDNQQAKTGWQNWQFVRDWTGPVGVNLVNPLAIEPWEVPHAQLEVYRKLAADPAAGSSRNRSGGFAAVGPLPGWGPGPLPGEYSPTGTGFGTNYVKLTITNLQPETEYKFYLWSFDMRQVWAASSNNPDSKFGVWSTTNPLDWLTNNGYPNGYAPSEMTDGTSGMPEGLAELIAAQGSRAFMMAPTNDNNNYIGGTDYCVSFNATTTPEGAINIYGWIDPTDWTGAMHMPLNGFSVVPEPATIALLGLGGLALLRKHRK